MKFSIDASILDDALSSLRVAVPKKTTNPIVKNVLMQLDQFDVDVPWDDNETRGMLTMMATDYQVGARVSLPVIMDEPGTILVDGAKLIGLIGAMSGKVTFNLSGTKMKMKSKGKSATLSTTDPDGFPEIESYNSTIAVCDCDTFIDFVTSIATCARKTDVSILAGIKLNISNNNVNMCATDGYIVGVANMPTQNDTDVDNTGLDDTVVYAEYFSSLVRGLKGAKSVSIGRGQSPHIKLMTERNMIKSEFSILTIAGDYPNVDRLLESVVEQSKDKDSSVEMLVELAQVQDAVKPIKLFDSNIIKLSSMLEEEDEKLILEIVNADDTYIASIDVEFLMRESDRFVAINSDYLTTVLNGTDNTFRLTLTNQGSSQQFSIYESDNIMFVVMGMLI